MDLHTQCRLVRGSTTQVSWIPKEFAEKGRIVDLREPDKTWDRGWTVDEVFSDQPSETVAARSQDYKKTRKASDI